MKNLSKFKPQCYVLLLLITSMTYQNCAPVFSELQSARTVGKNRVEFTPSYSSVAFSEDGESDGIQNHIGLQVAYGISEKLDIRFRYELIWLKDDEFSNNVSIMGIGPKYSVIQNKLAFYLPIGRAFGEDTDDTWQLHPTVLFTIPALEDKIDITISSKYLVTLCKSCDDYISFNFGAAFSNDLNKWAIRPEYGLLFNPGESGHFSQFSLGFSVSFGK